MSGRVRRAVVNGKKIASPAPMSGGVSCEVTKSANSAARDAGTNRLTHAWGWSQKPAALRATTAGSTRWTHSV